jgi:hypothetical protein
MAGVGGGEGGGGFDESFATWEAMGGHVSRFVAEWRIRHRVLLVVDRKNRRLTTVTHKPLRRVFLSRRILGERHWRLARMPSFIISVSDFGEVRTLMKDLAKLLFLKHLAKLLKRQIGNISGRSSAALQDS